MSTPNPAASPEPVQLRVCGHHEYKSRGKHKNGCGYTMGDNMLCMKAKTHADHISLPPSLNMIGSRGGHFTYASLKEAWELVLAEKLKESGLPQDLHGVSAEGLICFPRLRKERDQGNFRWFIEKCLGDALVAGGYIQNDSIWPERIYDFGDLDITYQKGESWTQIVLFPR